MVMNPGPPPGGGCWAPSPLRNRTEVSGAQPRKASSPPEFRGQKSKDECFCSSPEHINLQTPMSLERGVFSLAESPGTIYFYQ